MQLGFNTNDLVRAKCALILYAMYRSRKEQSPLNGLETWGRFTAYIRGAAMKSTTTAEFVQQFCKTAKIGSIQPRFLQCDGDFVEMSDGSLIESNDLKSYHTDIFEDDSLLPIFGREGLYLTMLVRERLQREKVENKFEEVNENENED